jgi:PAS domain S-box-containing protein
VIDMNPALERLVGWTLREARGQPCCDIVGCQPDRPVEGAGIPACPHKIEAMGQDRAFLEYEIQTRDGRSLPVEASYGLIRDEDGLLTRVVMIFRDITRQKELNRLRAEIVANVSHELRTPLALIKGYASTLLSPEVALDENKARRFLGNVKVAADHLSRLIDDLLCASRLEAQQLRLQLQRFDLVPKVHHVVAWFQPYTAGCRLLTDLPAEGLEVWADPDRVEQVLVNLLTNAVKYSPAGGIVTVQCRLLSGPRQVVVHITDEGTGIAPQHVPHIFDRFYLTEASQRGVGLGLYICKGLVEAMGGDVWVVSEVGQGSTFSFTLPVAANVAAAVST